MLYNLYKIPKRSVVEITPIYIPKTVKTTKFFLYSGMKLYNKLPNSIKQGKNFKSKLRYHISSGAYDTND